MCVHMYRRFRRTRTKRKRLPEAYREAHDNPRTTEEYFPEADGICGQILVPTRVHVNPFSKPLRKLQRPLRTFYNPLNKSRKDISHAKLVYKAYRPVG